MITEELEQEIINETNKNWKFDIDLYRPIQYYSGNYPKKLKQLIDITVKECILYKLYDNDGMLIHGNILLLLNSDDILQCNNKNKHLQRRQMYLLDNNKTYKINRKKRDKPVIIIILNNY